MLHFKSLLSRIMFLHVAALVVTAILMPLMLYWLFSSEVERLQQLALQEQTESLARHVTRQPDGTWSLELPASLRDQYSSQYGRYSYAVIDDTDHVLFSSREDRKPIFPFDRNRPDITFFETSRGGRVISGASFPTHIDGHTVWVQVGEDLAHRDVLIDDVVANFIPKVGWIVFPILLLLLASDFVIFRRSIQPLLHASDQAAHISPTRIDVRLPIDDIPREIRPLVIAVNQALDRLEAGFRQQREFTADAAHELRTPLAILRTRIDTWPDKSVADALRRDVEGMSRVVNQLLDAAEVETTIIDPDEIADLRQVCLEVAEFVAPIALADDKAIALTGTESPVWIKGNADMLQRALINLVENALKHTPKGMDVEIAVEQTGVIHVLDQGTGIPLANRKRIFERFWRRDRRRTGGAGLGLSIVKRIVEAHGGSIFVENRRTGCADFSMHFPLIEGRDLPPSEEAKPPLQARSQPAA